MLRCLIVHSHKCCICAFRPIKSKFKETILPSGACYQLTIWDMPSHASEDHVHAQDCLVYTPSQAFCKNFNIQLQVIPQKPWQCFRRNCRIHKGGHMLKRNNHAAAIIMQIMNHRHHQSFYNTPDLKKEVLDITETETVHVTYGRE